MTQAEELAKRNAENESLRKENIRLKDTLHRAINELCIACGRYKDEHLGACDCCPWHPVKGGEL